jgi:hypothetical protein
MFSGYASRSILFAAALTVTMASTARAQIVVPPHVPEVSLSGPRFGMTFLGQGIIDKLAEHDIKVGPMISQFGWQFEKRLYTGSSGLTALNEWILLVGGLDQGVALPSLSWMVGLRTKEGAELGLGPNITPLGVGLAFAAGTTFRAGALNIPVNIAVVPSKSGVRVSFLTGFNTRRR